MTEQTPRTRAVRAGMNTDPAHGAVVPPVYLSTTYAFSGFDAPGDFDYSRAGNPTRSILGRALGDLEGGAEAVVTASGMAAVTTVLLALLPPGGTVLAPFDCYGGSWRVFDALERTGRLRLRLADLSDPEAAAAALAGGADLVWLETPSNPLLRITDIAALSAAAHAAGAVVAADNTFATPVVQRPLALGADAVVHSATKYLNGHSDVTAGAIMGARDRIATLAPTRKLLGTILDPAAGYAVSRGLKTLEVRMARHNSNGLAVAEALQRMPGVAAVHYPGLASHPDHTIAAAQMRGFGGMVTVELAGGEEAARQAFDRLQVFQRAASLGGVESLCSLPVLTSQYGWTDAQLAQAGVTRGMLRLSVGLEDPQDLIDDLAQARAG